MLSPGKALARRPCYQAGGGFPRVRHNGQTNLAAGAGEGQPSPAHRYVGAALRLQGGGRSPADLRLRPLVPLTSFQSRIRLHFFITSLPFSAKRPGRLTVLRSTPPPSSVSSGESRDGPRGGKSFGNRLCARSLQVPSSILRKGRENSAAGSWCTARSQARSSPTTSPMWLAVKN